MWRPFTTLNVVRTMQLIGLSISCPRSMQYTKVTKIIFVIVRIVCKENNIYLQGFC
jgi:hypothetical protein